MSVSTRSDGLICAAPEAIVLVELTDDRMAVIRSTVEH